MQLAGIYNLRQVAELLGIAPNTFYLRVREGLYPEPVRIGRRPFYTEEMLAEARGK
jgi:predicted DNA-binding transcriptional regulator AlpA